LHLSNDDGDDVMDNGKDIIHERTAARGIDFYYDEAAGTLHLQIQYSSHVISDKVVQQVLPGAGIDVVGKLDYIAPFRIGTLFVVNGILHQITNYNVATNMVELQRGNNDNDVILMPERWVETSLNAANE
jgi:hypothetical protein